jgi:endonuclease-3
MSPADIDAFFATLQRANPHPASELHYASVFELLCAVAASAQATDVSVNKATRTLFVRAPTPQRMLAARSEGIEPHVRAIGLPTARRRSTCSRPAAS